MFKRNIILATDSYKASHWLQYPPNTRRIYSYIESRGGPDEIVFMGLQPYLMDYLSVPVTQEDVEEAAEFFAAHGEPFNRAGWEYIVNRHKGILPVKIRALPEGSVVKPRTVMVTIYNTDPECYWLPSYLETALIRAIWYPTTVATVSREAKKIIKKYFDLTSDDPSGINFKLHDFGARGVSSSESAAIGGMAHLVNFQGSDTVEGVIAARRYYGADMAAFSIPAAEHSTITAWGKENEVMAYNNMVDVYSKPGSIYAVVSDSYDIFNAVDNIWGETLKAKVLEKGGLLVVRPDSGDPTIVPVQILESLAKSYGYTTNSKGFKVLNNVRVIQGDGVNLDSINKCLKNVTAAGFAVDNIAFGMGGALLQHVNKDTLKFAMKCSAIETAAGWKDVFKNPVTDPGKASKAGRLAVDKNFSSVQYGLEDDENMLKVKYEANDGHFVMAREKFDDIRARAAI